MNPEETTNNPETTPPAQEKKPIKSLRTFQGDVQEAIGKNNFSTTKIFVSEEKRRQEHPEISDQTVGKMKARNKTFILFGSVFVLLGIISVGGLYYIKSNEKVAVEQKTKTLIGFSEERKISPSSREDLLAKFSENRDSWNMAVNSVLYVNLVSGNSEITTEKMLGFLAPSMLSSLKRSFGEKYTLGLYSFDTNEPFIIINVNDYSLAYSGMLKWEESMFTDIGRLFGIAKDTAVQDKFIDETIKNKDLRILRETSGKSLIVYSFIDRETLIIARNEDILSALVDKININKQTK